MSLLSNYSTCEISDALIKLGVGNGGHLTDIRMVSPAPSSIRICGPAYTVKIVFTSDTSAPNTPKDHFVDTIPPNSVVVIEAPHQAKNAVWGGLMTAGAQARKASGVVISGRCRDIAEHRAANFPVFARSQSTLGQALFTRPCAVNVPLVITDPGITTNDELAAVHVLPGDWIIADEDGVVCVPKSLEGSVAELASKGKQVDALCMEDIKAGKGVQASFKKHRGSG